MTTKRFAAVLVVIAVAAVPAVTLAASAPPGATALCNDGTASYGEEG